MTPFNLFIKNDSDLDDSAVKKWIGSIQRSLLHDFAPHYNCAPTLHFLKKVEQLTDDMWGGAVTNTDSKDYLGEHHLGKMPRFVICLPACRREGVEPSTVLDHEVKELAADPPAVLCDELDDGTLLAHEASDPVEGSSGTYYIDGVALENFVIPLAYFQGIGSRYDFRGVLRRPFGEDLAPGGYQLIKRPGGNWTQNLGSHVRASKQAPWEWSRRGRRMARGRALVVRQVGA